MTSPPTDIHSLILTPLIIDSLSYAEKLEAIALLEKREKILSQNKLYGYKPYPKQLEFHNAGSIYRERMFLAGNQLGKTLSAGNEAAYHATGLYPDWWRGRRIVHANKGWVGAPSGEFVRDNAQRILFGEVLELGTGTIPKELIIGRPTMAHGTSGLIDMARVRHVSGDTSIIKFKTYDQGREKWQGTPVDWIWPDEEPPMDIYMEALTRTNATKGFIFCTLTPLLGMSDTVMRFIGDNKAPDTHVIMMGIDDADHFTPEERAKIIASYRPHEREARVNGTPMLGSGRIFPIAEEDIKIDPIAIPKQWPQIGGMDFGYDHPFAAVRLAWDRENDCLYVTAEYRAAETTPIIHAASLRPWGKWLPWAWPHDGLQHDKGSGDQLAEIYRQQELKMLNERATFDDGKSNGVEAGLMEMLDRMQTGRLKVFNTLTQWFEEFRLYHRKDGKIIKQRDDLLCATRYALMMKRHAKVQNPPQTIPHRQHEHPCHGPLSWMAF